MFRSLQSQISSVWLTSKATLLYLMFINDVTVIFVDLVLVCNNYCTYLLYFTSASVFFVLPLNCLRENVLLKIT